MFLEILVESKAQKLILYFKQATKYRLLKEKIYLSLSADLKDN